VVHAVDGVSLTVAPGESVGLVGESGSGKTMTGMSVLRLLPPGASITGGSVSFDGTELTELSDAAMRRLRGNDIALISQDPMSSLNPTRTIGSQLRGDGHAAQGDGEVGGTAIECPMTTEATVDLITGHLVAGDLTTGRPLAGVHAETPAGRITFGFDADLNVAMGDALDAMVTWMQLLYDLDKATALALASTCVDLRITQVANQTWGVHAVLPDGVLS